MAHNLDYIREALAKDKNAYVEVLRITPPLTTKNGEPIGDAKITKARVKAKVALEQLGKPEKLRSYVFRRMYPLGHPIASGSMATQNSLSQSALAQEIEEKDKRLAELEAKLAELESKPKPGRKPKAESGLSESAEPETETTTNEPTA